MVMAGRGNLVGLPVVSNRELLVVHGTPEAPVPIEVDPAWASTSWGPRVSI